MICPNCGGENRDEAKFCRHCRSPLGVGASQAAQQQQSQGQSQSQPQVARPQEQARPTAATNGEAVRCPQCKGENRVGAKFCRHCRAPLEGVAINPETAAELDYIGLAKVRSDLAQIVANIKSDKELLAAGAKNINPYKKILVFQGNAGTGKTTVAEAFAKELSQSGCLETNIIISSFENHSMRARDIKSELGIQKLPVSEAGVNKFLKDRKPGALIIDEAVEDEEFLHEVMLALFHSEQNCITLLLGTKERFDAYFKKFTEDKNRVSGFFDFHEQSNQELALILEKKFAEMNFTVDEDAVMLFVDFVGERRNDPAVKHVNGWLVENDCVKIIRDTHQKRIDGAGDLPASEKLRISSDDVPLKVRPKTVEEIIAELDSFIGLAEVKATVRELAESVKMQMKRLKEGLAADTEAVHYVFSGNPGTGKTTIALKLGEIFKAMKLLESGHVVNADRSSLVAGYVGQTATKVQEACDKAMGGILFVDEAYALKQGSGDSFGQEAIDTLLKRMDDDRGKFIVIAAGYKEPMEQFIQSNPGLPSRFTKVIHFADYNADELFQIFVGMVKKGGYQLSDETADKLREATKDIDARKGRDFANGRSMRLLYEASRRRLSGRVMKLPTEEQTMENMSIFLPEDIDYTPPKAINKEDVFKELDGMIGLQKVKDAVRNIEKTIEFQKLHAEQEVAKPAGQENTGGKAKAPAVHFVFTGNPGTGKTTVARILGKLFKAIGLLPNGHVIDTDRSGLVAEYTGQTAPKTLAKCEEAMGGILLVDEAYTLAGADPAQKDTFGQEAIDALLKKMEDDRGKFVVIAAGYKDNMDNFINSNPGLQSRFTDYIHLDDYSAEELFAIYKSMVEKNLYTLDEGAEAKAQRAIEEIHRSRSKTFANGREMRTFYEKTERRLADRVMLLPEDERRAATGIIVAEDIPWEEPAAVSPSEVLEELNALTGLGSVKLAMDELTKTISAQVNRRKMGLKGKDQEVHFIFTGNPGTGKTTVARMMGRLFKAMGLLPTDKVIEVSRAELVAGYVGQTAKMVQAQCDKAMGGILFIDEAYALVQGDSDAFGKEAVDTLLKRMEDDRGNFVVIAAGYPKNMDDWLHSNPGLPSRFTSTLHLEDYTPDELFEIFTKNAASQDYVFDDAALELAKLAIEELYRNRGRDWANARSVREFLNTVVRRQSSRIANLSEDKQQQKETYQTIIAEDIPFVKKEEPKPDEILQGLNAMTGLTEIKEALSEICSSIAHSKMRQKPGEEDKNASPVHFLFMGNPGTGKTTVARKMGALFKAMGLIPTDRVFETTRADFVAQYVGQTAPLVNKTCDKAEGGILFIDEAYALVQGPQDSFGLEAVAALLKRMEDDRGKYIVIAAGYEREMKDFLASNSGFASRFSHELHLADYKPDELYEIFTKMVAGEKYVLDDEAAAKAKQLFVDLYTKRKADFANGRTVRNIFEATVRRLSTRVGKLAPAEQVEPALSLIKAEDI